MGALVAIVVSTWLICAFVAAGVWSSKGGSYGAGFALGLLLGYFGLFYVAFAKPQATPAARRAPARAPMSRQPNVPLPLRDGRVACARCGRENQAGRVACIGCGSYFANTLPEPRVEATQGQELAAGAGASGASPATSKPLVEQLERLARLNEAGQLSSREFEAAKARLLGLE